MRPASMGADDSWVTEFPYTVAEAQLMKHTLNPA